MTTSTSQLQIRTGINVVRQGPEGLEQGDRLGRNAGGRHGLGFESAGSGTEFVTHRVGPLVEFGGKTSAPQDDLWLRAIAGSTN
jgi:hypothetical protein